MRWPRSVVSVVVCIGLLAACDEASTPSSVAESDSASTADCSHWIGMPAPAVAEELRRFSMAVSWRLEHTDAETGPVSDVVADPPEGTVTNLAVADGEIVVFVSPVDDPLQEFAASSLGCPEQ